MKGERETPLLLVTGDEWAPPIPLGGANLPPFPVDVLPRWLAEWAESVASAVQTPTDLPGVLALAVISLAISKRFRVRVKPGWEEPTNIYALVAMAPGEGKSPVFRMATAPIRDFERTETLRLRGEVAAKNARRDAAEERLAFSKRNAAKAKEPDREAALAEVDRAAEELTSMRVAVAPRWIVDDATSEAIALRLYEQGGRLGIMSPEGGPLEIIAGRYSDGPNLEVLLMAHSGDKLTVDRVSRAPIVIEAPALTVALTVQPAVLAGLGTKPGFRSRGLLARFLYAVPPSRVGSRQGNPAPVSDATTEAYADAIGRLLRLPEQRSDDGQIVSSELTLTEDAVELLIGLKNRLEPELAPGGAFSSIAEWVNKLPGATVRLAAVLHAADCAEDESKLARPIDSSVMARAIRIGEYLLTHAQAALEAMGADPALVAAKDVVAWLRRIGQGSVTKRDIQRAFSRHFAHAADVDPTTAALVELGYLREGPKAGGTPGRPPSPVFDVNPALRSTQWTELAVPPNSVRSVGDPSTSTTATLAS